MLNKIIEWINWEVKIPEVDHNLVLAYNVATLNVNREDVWYLNVGYNSHMCGKKE